MLTCVPEKTFLFHCQCVCLILDMWILLFVQPVVTGITSQHGSVKSWRRYWWSLNTRDSEDNYPKWHLTALTSPQVSNQNSKRFQCVNDSFQTPSDFRFVVLNSFIKMGWFKTGVIHNCNKLKCHYSLNRILISCLLLFKEMSTEWYFKSVCWDFVKKIHRETIPSITRIKISNINFHRKQKCNK